MRSRVLAVLVLVASFLAPSYAGTLAVPVIGQEMDNWCWNASSNMVLQFNGFPHTQTEVAVWAVGGYNVPNHLSSTTVGPLLAVAGDPCSTYNRQGCGLVLTQFGPVDSSYLSRCLTMDEIKEEIDGDRPALLLIRWLDGGTDVGGHIIVLRGYETGDKVALADPWPADNNVHGAGTEGVAYLVDYTDLFTAAGKYSDASAAIGNSWTRTLKTGRILDLCFLIDSTGSMGDDIASVKAASLSMIDDLVANYKNLRIAVVDYRDNYTDECPSCASSGDWITMVRSAFTEDANVARAAINAISTGGGNDLPEAVFSALIRTMSGSEIGEWRKDAERHIILMGDAPGHDPEPWTGGYSYADVLAYCAADPNKKFIDALLTGGGSDVEEEFGGFAAATGGTVRSASGSDAGEAMEEIIAEFTETPRSPRGDVAAFKPTFTFTPPTEAMGPAVKNVLLEIQQWKVNAKTPEKSAWKKYMLVKLAGDATSWTPVKSLPQGDYKWRTGYVRGAGVFTLPSGTKTKIKAATLVEPNWTDFTRVEIEAAIPDMVSPDDSFIATDKEVDYTFGTVPGATGYALGISTFKESAEGGAWKLWKKVMVKPPADANATITVTVKGHTLDAEYEWSVQSLNFDHPKPVWTP